MSARKQALQWVRRRSRDVAWQIARDLREISPQVSGRVLDLGCGGKPYEPIFAAATKYVGVDLPVEHSANKMEKRADVYAQLGALPLADASFDAVVCTQVLEHAPDPDAVLAEARRVLRDSGLAVFSVPFLAAEHEMPHDYYRYTPNGMEALLGRHGFTDVRVKKQFGFWSAVGEMIYWHYHRKVTGTRWEKYWYAIGTTVFLRCFHAMNWLDRDERLVLNLMVTARKLPQNGTGAP